MFSGPVTWVGGTRIFARGLGDGRQVLAYAMQLSQDRELAMILPIPTPPAAPDDAVEFIDLSGTPDIFDTLEAMFAPAQAFSGPGRSLRVELQEPTLVVHEVGAYRASFVPRRADFARLDPLFRLPPEVWDQLPRYADHGFVVFALRPPHATVARRGLLDRLLGRREPVHGGDGGRQRVHPMAFRFPRRDPREVFFPTVHVHDGEVHPTARFDHVLYLQTEHADWAWERSLTDVTDVRLRHIAENGERVHRRALFGELPNTDQIVSPADVATRTREQGPCAVQLDGPLMAKDAAALDATLERLRTAAAPLGLELSRDLPPMPTPVPGSPRELRAKDPGIMPLFHVLPDGRWLRARIALRHAPDDATMTALRTALQQFS
jgi:hypothetical protein